jgi:HAMP domain-containing protein
MSLLEVLAKTQFFWGCILLYFLGIFVSSWNLRLFAMLLILTQALILGMVSDVRSMHPHCLRYHSEE